MNEISQILIAFIFFHIILVHLIANRFVYGFVKAAVTLTFKFLMLTLTINFLFLPVPVSNPFLLSKSPHEHTAGIAAKTTSSRGSLS